LKEDAGKSLAVACSGVQLKMRVRFWGSQAARGVIGTRKDSSHRGATDWNLYAIVAFIELARTETQNPEVPDWLREDYFHSIKELARMGTRDILSAEESETKRAILSIIVIASGLRTHGKFLVAYSEDELLEMEP
jgi:hypothetical protein